MPDFLVKAVERPEEWAIDDGLTVLTWSQVRDVVFRASNGLLALGLDSDARVAVFAQNSSETVLSHIAALFAGISTVPINFHLKVDELSYILSDSGAQVLFVGPETVDVGIEAARRVGIKTVVAWRSESSDDVLNWSSWLESSESIAPRSDLPPKPSLLYTSGTTGTPKGAEVPPTTFLGGRDVHEHLERMQNKALAKFGTHLVAGPMYHTAPLSAFRLLAVGVPLVVMRKFDPAEMLRLIEFYRIETTVVVPTHFIRLLQLPESVRSTADVSSLKFVTHTGASCPIEVKEAMIAWWGPIFLDAYGATEVGATCQITSQEWLEHKGSVGRPIPPFSALVVDDAGKELAPHQEGLLYFVDETKRGIIYHGNKDLAKDAHLRDGVFTLGEIGYVDNDGYVFITDRSSDMVVSGGVNIYPAESERVLMSHPRVKDIAVIGVPDDEMGERLLALVQPMDGQVPPDPIELRDYCRQTLAHYKCPRTFEIVETVGRSAMGKVNKRQLRATYTASNHQDLSKPSNRRSV